jgi:hypothetical protein
MHDFDYDVMEKKRIASGARHRKRGSKSKKCTLPSDYLTSKQKKGLNGKMVTYSLAHPTSYSVFENMPKDLQKEYLNKLYNDWGVSLTQIANMMHCSPETIRSKCIGFGFNTTKKYRSNISHPMSTSEWEAWCLGEEKLLVAEHSEDMAKDAKCELSFHEEKAEKRSALVQNFTFTICGTSEELQEKIESMLVLCDKSEQYQVRIECTKSIEFTKTQEK